MVDVRKVIVVSQLMIPVVVGIHMGTAAYLQLTHTVSMHSVT